MKQVLILLVAGTLMITSCVRNKNPYQAQQETGVQVNEKKFAVTEVINGNSYTYLKVNENMVERWVAVSRQEVTAGDVYYYDDALEMTNFHSKELDRTFDVIYFVNAISKTPMGSGQQTMGAMPPHGHSSMAKAKSAEVEMEKSAGELTVADLFENRSDYAKKQFEIRGIVVKVNREVMGKNWVHIQDGTESGGKFDLTITTQAEVQVGDEVTFKGKLTLEKDFGAGYFYDVIVEDGTLVNSRTL